MARRIKSMVKFSNVDILEFMGKVVEKHTQYYQSDFQIDEEILRKAAVSGKPQDKTFVWLCRIHGTWCLLERNVFLKGTRENSTFSFYMEQTREPVLAFVIEITSDVQNSITGNIYALDYAEYHKHVQSVSLNAETVLVQYEHGCRVRKADERIDGYPDTEYGKLVSVQYQPDSEKALTELLQRERQEGVYCREGHANAYISRLS